MIKIDIKGISFENLYTPDYSSGYTFNTEQYVFNQNYEGYAIFPNNTWVTNSAYIKNGNVVRNNRLNNQEIADMNVFVQETYEVKDAILDSNYYSFYDD